MTAPLGVLLVGYAGVGHQDHQAEMYAPGFAGHPGFRVIAVSDIPDEGDTAAKEHADALGVPWMPDLDEALRWADVDVVSVCVPFDRRVEVTAAALHAGKHVLVDKPMALTVNECAAIASVAAETGLICMPAHHQRFHPVLRAARAAIAAGRVGLPWNVQADFLVAGGGPVWPLGELLNFAPYATDAVQALTGLAVTHVYATAGAHFHDQGPEDLVVLCLTHERGLTSTVVAGRTRPQAGVAGLGLHRYRISGSHGTLLADAARPAVTVRTGDGMGTRWSGAGTVHHMLDELHTAIRSGRPADLGPADAVTALSIVRAAEASIETGRPVPLEPDKVALP
ncbi:Gfo/Idh/MocA family protein [Actinomadura rubrisoli]|uniref:Gfo/Idh/MocA family oxidoreductase n=1 Tax=Actinomadura rubrisoli TaxID=2530368 RepID=A0A4R5CDP5_9ACTN|nr:Gfo/Idh/MocA family oxidoreductase [Actinomadura rubrisoli]TDD96420.1 Gfo/Idh/MocA family oxidoreductase [Actinomadura rubrisoli]